MNNTTNNENLEERNIDREFREAFKYPIPLWKALIIGGSIGGLVGLIMGIVKIILSKILG